MNPYMNNPYPMQNQYMTQQQKSNGITWVQGIEGAKAYQMSANSNAIMLDSEIDGRFYIKTCDDVGMSKLRVFKFEEVTDFAPQTNNVDLSQYVRKDELQALLSNVLSTQEVVNNEQSISTAKRNTTGKPRALITE